MSADPARAAAPPGPGLRFDVCAKFHQSIRISGWVVGDRVLESIASPDPLLLAAVVDPAALARNPQVTRFAAQLLLAEDRFPHALALTLKFSGLAPRTLRLGRIAELARRPEGRLQARFDDWLREPDCQRILDLGGRARSGVLWADSHRDKNVVVLDVVAADGVDVVCDAHRMSKVLPPESFDAVFSQVVFEHLAMPWKVAVEMNRVMRSGAIALINAPQTCGMHDMPWDYFRFSDNAWKSLFNPATGFEILGTELGSPQHVLPVAYSDLHREVEKTVGFENSSVLVRKIGRARVDWPLTAADITSDVYPA